VNAVPLHRRPAGPRGVTLVELMVAVVIGLIITLAASAIVLNSERGRRSITSSADVNLTAAYLSYVVDRELRGAGSGFASRWRDVFGCTLTAARSGTTILPRGGPFPAPFAGLPTTVRMAPVIIHADASAAGSDVVVTMTGQSGFSESPSNVLIGSVTNASYQMRNTLGHRAGDLVMLVEPGLDCMLQQVATGFAGSTAQTLSLGGTYYADTVNGSALTARGAGGLTTSLNLGNASGASPPRLTALGVGDNATLFSYDLLRIANGDTPMPIAEGVAELRALYGVDTNDDGTIDAWQSPAAAPWNAASLLDGSGGAQTNLRRILAVRVSMVLRSTLVEREEVAPDELTLFADLDVALQRTYAVASADRTRRHRVAEFIVPLRNMLLLPLT
jgi:type IV pilus assembly protein PilW